MVEHWQIIFQTLRLICSMMVTMTIEEKDGEKETQTMEN